MFSILRLFWLVSLSIFLSGCSGFGVAGFSRPDRSFGTGQKIGTIWDLKPGDQAILELVDGRQIQGVVQFTSPFEILLDPEGNSLQPRGFTTAEIFSIKKNPPSHPGPKPKS